MREHRTPPTGDARHRANVRSASHVYVRRGVIKRQPCEVCGTALAWMLHTDADPHHVRWLCLLHHHTERELFHGEHRDAVDEMVAAVVSGIRRRVTAARAQIAAWEPAVLEPDPVRAMRRPMAARR